jgi:hypothetical protein
MPPDWPVLHVPECHPASTSGQPPHTYAADALKAHSLCR